MIPYAALRASLLGTPTVEPRVVESVQRALAAVARDGLAAALRLTAQYDRVELTSHRLAAAVVGSALSRAEPELLARIHAAHARGEAWGQAQRAALGAPRDRALSARWIPRPALGLYLRGSGAGLEAAAFTVGVARAAGIRRLVAATPPSLEPGAPGSFGAQPLAVLLCGALEISELWLLGGAQAVAMLAQETGLVAGPGGGFAEEAKRQLAPRFPAVPAPAEELLVIADASADLPALRRHLPSRGRTVLLALEGPLDLPGVEQAVVSRDQTLLLGQAWAPAQVALFVADPERWLGLFTGAGMISVGTIAPFVPGPPLHALLQLQPLQLPE